MGVRKCTNSIFNFQFSVFGRPKTENCREVQKASPSAWGATRPLRGLGPRPPGARSVQALGDSRRPAWGRGACSLPQVSLTPIHERGGRKKGTAFCASSSRAGAGITSLTHQQPRLCQRSLCSWPVQGPHDKKAPQKGTRQGHGRNAMATAVLPWPAMAKDEGPMDGPDWIRAVFDHRTSRIEQNEIKGGNFTPKG